MECSSQAFRRAFSHPPTSRYFVSIAEIIYPENQYGIPLTLFLLYNRSSVQDLNYITHLMTHTSTDRRREVILADQLAETPLPRTGEQEARPKIYNNKVSGSLWFMKNLIKMKKKRVKIFDQNKIIAANLACQPAPSKRNETWLLNSRLVQGRTESTEMEKSCVSGKNPRENNTRQALRV